MAPSACVYDGSQRCGPHQVLLGAIAARAKRATCPGERLRSVRGGRAGVERRVRVRGRLRTPRRGRRLRADAGSAGHRLRHRQRAVHRREVPAVPRHGRNAGLLHQRVRERSTIATAATSATKTAPTASAAGRRSATATAAQSDDDCAEGEATYCETIQSHLCLVPLLGRQDRRVLRRRGLLRLYDLRADLRARRRLCAMNGGKEVQ